jgi:hypothetical protein
MPTIAETLWWAFFYLVASWPRAVSSALSEYLRLLVLVLSLIYYSVEFTDPRQLDA